ncbi:hypothetical protein KUCAC02_026528 [Chaenocephalus aceratus]|nr:hypothetical protein KUCAC02_026528 [Chaenocephalus aceratus]
MHDDVYSESAIVAASKPTFSLGPIQLLTHRRVTNLAGCEPWQLGVIQQHVYRTASAVETSRTECVLGNRTLLGGKWLQDYTATFLICIEKRGFGGFRSRVQQKLSGDVI